MKISDKELMLDLMRVKNIVNKIPSQADYIKYGKYSKNTYISRKPWSKWNESLFLFSNTNNLNEVKKISNDDLISNLKKLYIKLGRVPKKDDLRISEGSLYSMNAYRRAFGDLATALTSANLKPN